MADPYYEHMREFGAFEDKDFYARYEQFKCMRATVLAAAAIAKACRFGDMTTREVPPKELIDALIETVIY